MEEGEYLYLLLKTWIPGETLHVHTMVTAVTVTCVYHGYEMQEGSDSDVQVHATWLVSAAE
jgi:hypothetical protein